MASYKCPRRITSDEAITNHIHPEEGPSCGKSVSLETRGVKMRMGNWRHRQRFLFTHGAKQAAFPWKHPAHGWRRAEACASRPRSPSETSSTGLTTAHYSSLFCVSILTLLLNHTPRRARTSSYSFTSPRALAEGPAWMFNKHLLRKQWLDGCGARCQTRVDPRRNVLCSQKVRLCLEHELRGNGGALPGLHCCTPRVLTVLGRTITKQQ